MLDRTLAPDFVKNTSLVLPGAHVLPLNGGINAFILEGVQQDISKVELILRAGKWYETKIGVSHFTAQMLEKGTHSRSSSQLAAHFDRYGAHIEISPGSDFVSVSLYALNKNLEQVLPLLLEIITESTFPEDELTQLKEIYIQNLRINNEKTSVMASKAIRRNIYTDNHPYGSSIEERDVNQLSREDLRQFYRDFFHVSDIFLVTKSEQKFIDATLGHFSSLKKVSQEKVHAETPISPFAEKIDKPGSVQASIRLGKKTIGRSHPDYFSLLLLNHVLGGYFGSRLMKNIREEKGLTYGIYSSLNAMAHGTLMAIGADVNKENAQLTIAEIKKEIKLLQSEPVEPDELASAKGHFIGGLQAEISNLFAVAEKLKSIRLFSLDETYYQDMISKIDATTSEELLAMAATHLTSEDLFEVVVG